MKTSKPEPVVTRTICSLCGEEWERHGDSPTTLDCIRLLKAAMGLMDPYRWTPYAPYTTTPFISVNTCNTSAKYLTPVEAS